MQPSPHDEAGSDRAGGAPAADARARRREALACLRLLIAVSRADDATGQAELEALRALAHELGVKLRPADLAHDLDVAHVAAWVRAPALRERVLRDMALLALSDGHAEPLELALVRFVAARWGLPPPRTPGVDWDAVEVPVDLTAHLARRTNARDEGLARLQELLRARPRQPAAAPPAPGAPALVEQEALDEGEALALLEEPGSPPVLVRVDSRALVVVGSPAFAGGCLETVSSCGVMFVALPAVFGVPCLLARLSGESFMLALYLAAAAGGAVALRLLAGALAARRLRQGVFVPAVLQRVREEVVEDGEGDRRVVETGTLLYAFAGAVRRSSVGASRTTHASVPTLRVGERRWVFLHPDRPDEPVSLEALQQVATVYVPDDLGPSARLDAPPPARAATTPAVGDASLRAAGRVTVDVQAGQRCPFCLDGVGGLAPAELMTCAACRVVFHRECLAEAGSCSTAGCRNNRYG